MTKFQKKPVTVEAFQWGVDIKPKWAAEAFVEGTLIEVDTGIDLELHIETLEGEMTAEQGDFVIQGVHGEIYSCKPDIFKETYVKVDDTDRISPDDIGNDIQESLHGGDNKMEKLNEIQGYTARWYGEDGDLTIGGIDENDMTQEELNSKKQSVTIYTKKQVMELLAKGDK